MIENDKENEVLEKEADIAENNEKEKQDADTDNSENKEEITDDAAKLEKAENEAKDYLNRLQRCMAEFDNFRKRTITEKAGMYDNGVKDTVEKLLPVIDNFERAIESINENEKETSLYKGIEMTYKQFIDVLDNIGVKEIDAKGEKFNPNVHNAVMHIEDENFEENSVAEVLQKGYQYKDKVIRHSMVKVAN